jgi:thymidylate kinase
MASAAVLALVLLDWWVGYWTAIVRQRAKHGMVVFDRHLVDMLADPVRYRYGGPSWLVRVACRLAPRPDVILILDAPPEVVRARKQEVTLDESRRQRHAYRRLAADLPGTHLLDATAPSGQLLTEVTALLRQEIGTATGSGRRRG